MNILFFCPSAPYQGAESLVTLKLMKLLQKNGAQVDLIYYERAGKSQLPADALGMLSNCHAVNSRLRGRLGILEWCWRAFRAGCRLNQQRHYDLIVSRVMPVYGHLPALLLHCFKGIKWLANWSDPYPSEIAPPPYGRGDEAKIAYLKKIFCHMLVRTANYHTFPSARLMELEMRHFPELAGKSSVLPHVMLEGQEFVHSGSRAKANVFHMVYAGSVTLRHPEVMVTAVEELIATLRERPHIHIDFIGDVSLEFKSQICVAGVEEYFTLHGHLDYELVSNFVKDADVVLLLEARCRNGVFLSSKLLDYLQENKPVFSVSPTQGIMADLIASYGGGVCADCNSPSDVAQKLLEVYQDWENGRLNSGKYDVTALKNQFCENRTLNAWNKIMKQIKTCR